MEELCGGSGGELAALAETSVGKGNKRKKEVRTKRERMWRLLVHRLGKEYIAGG